MHPSASTLGMFPIALSSILQTHSLSLPLLSFCLPVYLFVCLSLYSLHSTYPAPVHLHVGLVPHGAELVFVVSEQLEREIVVARVVVVPGHGVDARVREVLIWQI